MVVLMILIAIGDGSEAVQRYSGVLNETALYAEEGWHVDFDFDETPTVHGAGLNESLLAPLDLGILKSLLNLAFSPGILQAS